jgi:hypothetical protein
MSFVVSQHLDSVRDKFHLYDFSHIGKEILEMDKQHSGTLSKLLPKITNIPEMIEELPGVIPLAKDKIVMRREPMKPNAHDKNTMKVSEYLSEYILLCQSAC